MPRAAFLDRDGVINKDSGYIDKIADFEFIDGVFEACRVLNSQGYEIVIVTNQSGIGRGYFSDADFQKLNQWMLTEFSTRGVSIRDVYYCPYHPQGLGKYRCESPYRKPNPQMLLDAAAQYALDLPASFMVGDRARDIQAGQAAGVGRCFWIRETAAADSEEIIDDMSNVMVYPSLWAMVEREFL